MLYTKSASECVAELESSMTGLSPQEAEKRLRAFGQNKLVLKGEPLWKMIIEPFADLFVAVLVLAAVLSFVTGHRLDAAIIVSIIFINAGIFYAQTYSTARVLRALKKQEAQSVRVFRGGALKEIPSELLVPGDVVALSEGEKVPADGRLLVAENVRADESTLTGESLPIDKNTHTLESERPVYERSNMLFQGSFVVSGRAQLLVGATGGATEFGKLAALSAPVNVEMSPAQQKINRLTTQLIVVVGVLVFAVFLLELFRGIEAVESLRFVMSLAVSAVPEGLPVAIAVILVLGMGRLARYNALARSMRAVENIGIVTTIATDKTGTLTKNKLAVQEIWQPDEASDAEEWLRLSVNTSDGERGDPLDIALDTYIAQEKITVSKQATPVLNIPFDQANAMSGVVWRQSTSTFVVALKGAPEKIIELCALKRTADRDEVMQVLARFTGYGYRVIALAHSEPLKDAPTGLDDALEASYELVGLVAIADELRPEAKQAIADAQAAGITVRMITGDHAETAYSIGRELGLVTDRSQVLDCRTIDRMSETELTKAVEHTHVFARVIPEAKHRILGVLKQTDITAMTGDGVNDVPALTNAHVGIAMGSGSQIAKEAGDIVLLDDNFASIVRAVEGGRVIYDNIRRMLYYLLSTNFGEVLVMIGALLLGLPLPVVAVQILWINLVTDTAFGIPLGLEPAEDDVMKRPPRKAAAPVLENAQLVRIVIVGFVMAVVTLWVFALYVPQYPLVYAQTIAFSALVVAQWANAFSARGERASVWRRLRVVNIPFIVGLLIAIGLQMLVLFGPLAGPLHVVEVAGADLVVTGIASFLAVLAASELGKYVAKRLERRS